MRPIDALVCLSFIAAAFGLLWCWLVVREIGPLEAIERVGLVLVAWARSQHWAAKLRRAEYEALRETFTVDPDVAELRQIVARS